MFSDTRRTNEYARGVGIRGLTTPGDHVRTVPIRSYLIESKPQLDTGFNFWVSTGFTSILPEWSQSQSKPRVDTERRVNQDQK